MKSAFLHKKGFCRWFYYPLATTRKESIYCILPLFQRVAKFWTPGLLTRVWLRHPNHISKIYRKLISKIFCIIRFLKLLFSLTKKKIILKFIGNVFQILYIAGLTKNMKGCKSGPNEIFLILDFLTVSLS